jgi:hypothetical protein
MHVQQGVNTHFEEINPFSLSFLTKVISLCVLRLFSVRCVSVAIGAECRAFSRVVLNQQREPSCLHHAHCRDSDHNYRQNITILRNSLKCSTSSNILAPPRGRCRWRRGCRTLYIPPTLTHRQIHPRRHCHRRPSGMAPLSTRMDTRRRWAEDKTGTTTATEESDGSEAQVLQYCYTLIRSTG